MDLPTDPDARIMALRMLGWELVTYNAGCDRETLVRYYGRCASGRETFSTDTPTAAWEWIAETEIGTRKPF